MLQLQDYGTSHWQLGHYAITLAELFGRSVMANSGARCHPRPSFAAREAGSDPERNSRSLAKSQATRTSV